jgi:ClpP class serine protease
MSFLAPHIASRIFDTPLMIADAKMAAILVGIGARVVDGGVTMDVPSVSHVAFSEGRGSDVAMGRLGDRLGRQIEAQGGRGFDMIDGIAVIGVEGTLVHKGAYVGQSSGQTSYQGIQAQVARARRDPSVRAAVFEVDSMGGEAAGAFETADMIFALSREKPTMAILTSHANSAAYLLAAPCRQIVMPGEGTAGSIGALCLMADARGALEQQGLKVTVVRAGAQKADTHPASPLATAEARLQAGADAIRNQFAASVGRYRGSRFNRAQAMATEAEVFDGVTAASIGLVDAVGAGNDAFEAFRKAVNRG